MFTIKVVLFLSVALSYTTSQTIDDACRLREYLTNISHYYSNIRPIINQSRTLEVTISQDVSAVEHVDISRGTIEISGYLKLTWTAETLVWDPSLFGNIRKTTLPNGHFWNPELAVRSAAEENEALFMSKFSSNSIYFNGVVDMYQLGNLITRCNIDTTLFPFDSHVCTLELYASMYIHTELSLMTASPYLGVIQPVENYEWEIVENSSQTLFSSGDVYKRFLNQLVIRRRAAFLILHQFIPSGLILCLNMFTCFVPLNSGERLSYSVTIFLAFVFFMDTVVDGLPKNSLNISVASGSFLIINAINTLTVIWSVICVRVSTLNKERHHIPWILQKMAMWTMKSNKPDGNKINKHSKVNEHDLCDMDSCSNVSSGDLFRENNETSFDKISKLEERGTEISVKISWLDVATALDKIYFAIIFLTIIAMCIVTGINVTLKPHDPFARQT